MDRVHGELSHSEAMIKKGEAEIAKLAEEEKFNDQVNYSSCVIHT